MNILSLQILQARITTAKAMRKLIRDYKQDNLYLSERKALHIVISNYKKVSTNYKYIRKKTGFTPDLAKATCQWKKFKHTAKKIKEEFERYPEKFNYSPSN